MKTEENFANDIFDLSKSKEERIQAAFHLEKAVKDESITKLGRALLALATLRDKSVIPFIKKFLNSKEPDVAESAEIALERLS